MGKSEKSFLKKKLNLLKMYCDNRRYRIKIDKNKDLKKIKIENKQETLNKIISKKISLCRFGDGEFELIQGRSIGFQEKSEKMSKRLKEILKSKNDKILIGIPDIINDNKNLTLKSRVFWSKYLVKKFYMILPLLSREITYIDSLITRPYIDSLNIKESKVFFETIKLLWKDKEIVLVEGKGSRLGSGNDLFSQVKSLSRITCPSKNAYSIYEKIYEEVVKVSKDKIILISLGPTATILAFDLAIEGHQALDIGHIDIEYEWFLMNAKEKVGVKNKYVNEVKNGDIIIENFDKKYQDEILIDIV